MCISPLSFTEVVFIARACRRLRRRLLPLSLNSSFPPFRSWVKTHPQTHFFFRFFQSRLGPPLHLCPFPPSPASSLPIPPEKGDSLPFLVCSTFLSPISSPELTSPLFFVKSRIVSFTSLSPLRNVGAPPDIYILRASRFSSKPEGEVQPSRKFECFPLFLFSPGRPHTSKCGGCPFVPLRHYAFFIRFRRDGEVFRITFCPGFFPSVFSPVTPKTTYLDSGSLSMIPRTRVSYEDTCSPFLCAAARVVWFPFTFYRQIDILTRAALLILIRPDQS